METKEATCSKSADKNNNDHSDYCLLETPQFASCSSSCSTSEAESEFDYNENFCDLLKQMQNNKDLCVALKGAGKIQAKYYDKRCMKSTEAARLLPIPSTFQKVEIITDARMSDGHVILAKNRASKIFDAIASAVFNASDILMSSHTKLMYLRQIERDYCAAKQSKDDKEIRKCIHLVNKTVLEHDGPWFDDQWLIASKAYFAPIHVMYNCNRVPSNPHIFRYAFSPVVNHESPIRIVVDNENYDCNNKK